MAPVDQGAGISSTDRSVAPDMRRILPVFAGAMGGQAVQPDAGLGCQRKAVLEGSLRAVAGGR